MLGIRSKIAQLSVRRCRPLRLDSGEIFRIDAKAEEDCVVFGGWESDGGGPPSEARWFSVVLTKASAPGAFDKGEPFRTIAALELLGALFRVHGVQGGRCLVARFCVLVPLRFHRQ